MRNKNSYEKFSYDEHAKTCAINDLHGQILRTSKGKPIDESQIQLIINSIKLGLHLNKDDILLDLGCGNGSISHHLFDYCKGYMGVDISNYLIDVAKKFFQRKPDYCFISYSVIDYVKKEQFPEHYTKSLCFAAFQYFSDKDAITLLTLIRERFTNISSIFIGNIPDKEQNALFYLHKCPSEEELTDINTAVGKWRTKLEVKSLAQTAGWNCSLSRMSSEFYAASYRYDVVLSRD
jgi:cyclopropane fatty-acyl-phospholipid synthase-like methyltransferase